MCHQENHDKIFYTCKVKNLKFKVKFTLIPKRFLGLREEVCSKGFPQNALEGASSSIWVIRGLGREKVTGTCFKDRDLNVLKFLFAPKILSDVSFDDK